MSAASAAAAGHASHVSSTLDHVLIHALALQATYLLSNCNVTIPVSAGIHQQATSLRRLSSTFSSKSTPKASLASQEDADSDTEAEADAVYEPQEPLAKRMLRRSTDSFKIGAKKLGAAVKPTCFGKFWRCSIMSCVKTE